MLFLYALFFSADTLASSITPGKVEMSGELIETACGIDPLSREIWVDFGDVSARDINMDSESHLTKDFNVHLTGVCGINCFCPPLRCGAITKRRATRFATCTP